MDLTCQQQISISSAPLALESRTDLTYSQCKLNDYKCLGRNARISAPQAVSGDVENFFSSDRCLGRKRPGSTAAP